MSPLIYSPNVYNIAINPKNPFSQEFVASLPAPATFFLFETMLDI